MRSAMTLAVCIGLGLLGLVPGVAHAAPQAPPAVSSEYRFGADTGLLVFHVHRERTNDFESVMSRLGQGLQATATVPRRDQAVGWRFFRARDVAETAIYVLFIDPVVRGADYDPVRMLTELVPGEAPALYERLKAAVVRVERLDLDRLP